MSVTAGAIVIGDKTFIAKNITSVRAEYGRKPSIPGVVVCAVIAVALFASSHIFLGLVATVFAFVMMAPGASKLFIVTAGGETMALQNTDAAFVRRVHDATVSASSR